MSYQFKVGDRVRIVYHGKHFGKCGTIWRIGEGMWAKGCGVVDPDAIGHDVDVDGYGRLSANGFLISYLSHNLRPLTDPKADEFIERIKQLGREPLIPVAA